MKLLILLLVLFAPLAQRPSSSPSPEVWQKPKIEYDKFRDVTKVSILLPIPSERDATLKLYISDSSKGQKYVPSDYIMFALMSENAVWLSSLYDRLYLLYDDDRIELEMKLSSARARFALLSPDTFHRIANSKTIEGKFGTTEFALKAADIKSLRAFNSLQKK